MDPQSLIPARTVSPFDACVNVAAFVIAAILATTLLVLLPQQPQFDVKFNYYLDHADEYDVVFVGTSFTERNIDPVSFDRIAGTSSFNLGYVGATWLEVDLFLNRVLKDAPPKCVIVEGFDPAIPVAGYYTERVVRWHDLPQTLRGMKFAWHHNPFPENVHLAVLHGIHFLLKHDVIARGRDRILPARFDSHLRGWTPYEPGKEDLFTTNSRRYLLEREGFYEGFLQTARETRAQPFTSTFDLEQVRSQARLLRTHGYRPLYWLPPAPDDFRVYHLAAEEGTIELFGAFDDPGAYPELFDPGHRWDHRHLDNETSQRFSEMLGRRYLETVGGGPSAGP